MATNRVVEDSSSDDGIGSSSLNWKDSWNKKQKRKAEDDELFMSNNSFLFGLLTNKRQMRIKIDGRKLPRGSKREFHHARAKANILEDFLGPNPLFTEKEFVAIYRISIARFNRIKSDVVSAKIPYYINIVDGVTGEEGPSLEARLLNPLRGLAYGVASHAFMDYFQMSVAMCREARKQFDFMMRQLYHEEYMRLPTPEDLSNISKLHQEKHKFPGMYGSLDCMHVIWNKCPVAWHGQYKKGTMKKPSLVLEAISDHHLWFWHASFGYCGTLNDINILDLSPFLESLLNGEFVKKEKESTAVPFTISNNQFEEMYVLVDGIYPEYSRFVHGIKQPCDKQEEKYTKWQEAARKDIERAFGVLQGKFQYMARPIEEHDLNLISRRVASCLILHNMCVSDRVMHGDVYARYNPMGTTVTDDDKYDNPKDRKTIQRRMKILTEDDQNWIGLAEETPAKQFAITRRDAWQKLASKRNARLLNSSLMKYFDRSPKKA